MDAIEITGGKRLSGEVEVSGSKNATLPQIAAALLAPGRSVFRGVPDLADIRTLGRLLGSMGARVEREGNTLHVDAERVDKPEAPYELVKTMRASVLVLGPLVARLGRARVSLPGGCAIGARPIDQHLKGLQLLGAKIELAHGYVEATASRLRGARVLFDLPTVTGTENLMMAAVLAEGQTVLENCAREPEVVALADELNDMGGRVRGAGTSIIAPIAPPPQPTTRRRVTLPRYQMSCAHSSSFHFSVIIRSSHAFRSGRSIKLRPRYCAGGNAEEPSVQSVSRCRHPHVPCNAKHSCGPWNSMHAGGMSQHRPSSLLRPLAGSC